MADNKENTLCRLIQVRRHLGLSSKDFANKAGVDPSNYSSVETGKRSFGDRVMRDVCEAFDINIDWLRTGEGEMFKDNRTVTIPFDTAACHIPLLPISAQGGSLNDFVISVKNGDCERVLSPIKGADFAMTITGDSMSPEYPAGSQILIKKINEQLFIEWGKVYVVDTANGVVVKIVTQSDKADCIRCSSINPDQKRYSPFDIPNSEIYGMYRVLLCMSLK